VNGQTTRTYVGKRLPSEVQEVLNAKGTKEVEASVLAADKHFVVSTRVATRSAKEQPTHTSSTVRLYVLGQLRLERLSDTVWQAVTDVTWQQPRSRSLLAYLVSCQGHKAMRTDILAALWPNGETTQDTLDGAVQSLKRVLEPTRKRQATHLLRSEDDSIMLADHVWIDADVFEDLLMDPEHSALSQEYKEQLLEQALALYGGDFLPEERRAPWATERRQVLHERWVHATLALVDLRIAHDAPASTLDLLDRLLAVDPLNEAAVRRLMMVLARLTRRGEALSAYHRFAEALQRDNRVEPSEETRQLYEAVARGGTHPSLVHRETGRAVVQQQSEKMHMSTEPLRGEAVNGDATQGGRVYAGVAVEAVQVGRTHRSPLIGRERELRTLRDVLLHVEHSSASQQSPLLPRYAELPLDTQRRPQCVLLLGEAGIGKTRLAEEASRQACDRGWSVIWSRAYAQESGIPYRIWIDVLRKALEILGPLGVAAPRTAQATTPHSLRDTLIPLSTLLPELQSSYPSSGGIIPSLREQEQLRLWEAVHGLLTGLSAETPLLIVLDDVQWADTSSCELLGYVARHLQSYPLLLLGTCRKNELSGHSRHPLHRLVEHMQREHSVLTMTLEPLTPEEIAALISSVPNLSQSMVQHIQSNAAGNPFFAEELARSTPPQLPKDVTAALDHRMKRLSEPCQQLLWRAAVLGGSFAFPLICSMEMEASRASMDEDTVLELLEEALQAGVITEEGTGRHITYHFWHPLLVNHLYEGISAVRRARMHQRAATVLQQMYNGHEEEVAATITHHLVRSEADVAQIIHYAVLAGDYAYGLSAYAEAERHYRLAVEQLKGAVASGSDAAIAGETSLAVLERLAECTMILGSFEEAAQLYDQLLAKRAMQQLHDAGEAELNLQYEAQIQALVWGEIGQARRNMGNSELARQCFERGGQVLHAIGLNVGPAWARLRYLQGMLYWQEGRYEEAQKVAQEALTFFSTAEQPHGSINGLLRPVQQTTRTQRTLEGDPINLGRTHRLLGSIANATGCRNEALMYLNTALAIYEQYNHKREIAHVCCNLGHVYLKRGDYELAQAALRRSLSLAEHINDSPLISVIFSNLAELAAASGDLLGAEDWYRRGLDLAEHFGDLHYVSTWHVGLATVLQAQGKLTEAATCITRAWRIARTMHNAPSIGAALVALAAQRLAKAQSVGKLSSNSMRLLMHAQKDIERALALEGLEAETIARGEVILARVKEQIFS
jgi:DNA-binding SARP family transcriptional activator/tetratricopeptide (TPR) repeat protein